MNQVISKLHRGVGKSGCADNDPRANEDSEQDNSQSEASMVKLSPKKYRRRLATSSHVVQPNGSISVGENEVNENGD